MNRQPHEGDYFWGAVILGVAAYDAWALSTNHETASHAMRRHTEYPWQKFLLCAGMGALALHFLSEEHDPFKIQRRSHEKPQAA